MAEDIEEMEAAVEDEESLEELVGRLADSGRRRRQDAAHRVAIIAREDAELLAPYIPDLIDALFRPEAQTRWEIFTALTELAPSHADECDPGFEAAEASLFDEGSATVRLASFIFLAALASTSPERSDAAWPMLDEAIQCYHGDPEYHDMLVSLLGLAKGNISDATAEALAARVAFDAENGVSFIKTFSAQILEALRVEGE